MRQSINETHYSDSDGNPAGGVTAGLGLWIDWQKGPLSVDGVRREPNGAFVDGVIAAALGRLKFYQTSKFACGYNERAIAHLEAALAECLARTMDRERRGVEGSHQA